MQLISFSRRKFLGTSLTAGAAGLLGNIASPSSADTSPDMVILQNDQIRVSILSESGCVQELATKDGAWKLQGAGLRLHVPAPDHRFHYLSERSTNKPLIEADDKQSPRHLGRL